MAENALVSETGLMDLAKNELSDGFLASPATSGDSLFLRSRTNLYRIDAK